MTLTKKVGLTVLLCALGVSWAAFLTRPAPVQASGIQCGTSIPVCPTYVPAIAGLMP